MIATTIQPHPYQARMPDLFRAEFGRGNKRAIGCMPTGAGKTITGMLMAAAALERGKTVMWVADRRILVQQAEQTAQRCGIDPVVLMARHRHDDGNDDWRHPWTVVSKDTLAARDDRIMITEPDLVFVDECHRGGAEVLRRFPDAFVVGWTATPHSENRGMRDDGWQAIVQPVTYAELQDCGVLVPCRVFGPEGNHGCLVGPLVGHWEQYRDRPTIAFFGTVAAAQAGAHEWRAAGYEADCVHADTPDDERERMYDALAAGRLNVLTSMGVLREGFDCPNVSCIVQAHSTESIVRYRQEVGRGLRAAPGKADCVLLDHGGNFDRFGSPDADLDWPLESRNVSSDLEERARRAEVNAACPRCGARFKFHLSKCPSCGHQRIKPIIPAGYEMVRGELVEKRPMAADFSQSRKKTFGLLFGLANSPRRFTWRQAWTIARQKGMQPDPSCFPPSNRWGEVLLKHDVLDAYRNQPGDSHPQEWREA